MTLLAASIPAETLGVLAKRAEAAWAGGAEAVEVRIDALEGDPAAVAAYLKAHRDRTWIVTCRSDQEGGHFLGDTRSRVATLIAAARGTDAYVDFELSDWRRSSNIRQKVLLAAARPDGSGHRLILSSHDFSGVPRDLEAATEPTADTAPASCLKIAYTANHICDTFAALDAMHSRRARAVGDRGPALSVIAMGEDGSWTRVLAKKLGAMATYCTPDEGSATAPGQITLVDMVGRYRWSSIDESTQVYGVLGDPVSHSMSPLLLNRWFADAGLNSVYLPLRVRPDNDGLARFLAGCRQRSWLDVGGFSVTIPHKKTALDWVGDGADSMARGIGALNTLVFGEAGVRGFNTDCYAAVSSLAGALGCSRSDLSGVTVDILGAGGAARAISYGLSEVGCRLTVYGRSAEKTRALAEARGAVAATWERRMERSGTVLINCTNVGMLPDVDATPLPAEALHGCRLVFDVVYNPMETRLLREASVAGVATLSGLDMFVRQAAMQFELWTGRSPDTRGAADAFSERLGPGSDAAP